MKEYKPETCDACGRELCDDGTCPSVKRIHDQLVDAIEDGKL